MHHINNKIEQQKSKRLAFKILVSKTMLVVHILHIYRVFFLTGTPLQMQHKPKCEIFKSDSGKCLEPISGNTLTLLEKSHKIHKKKVLNA